MEYIEYKKDNKVNKIYVDKKKNIKQKVNYQQYYLNYYNDYD